MEKCLILLFIFIVKAYGELPEHVGIEENEEGGEDGLVDFGDDSGQGEEVDIDDL